MLFNSLQFAILMIVVLLAVELFRRNALRLSLLLVSSYVFYYTDSGPMFVLLLFSSLLSFYTGKKVYENVALGKRKFFLILSIVGNLGVLAFFKYTNFAIGVANDIGKLFGASPSLSTLNIVLPVGLSFFTFQTMGYTFDIYREKLKPTNSFLKYALFISFFPQLVAGPIVRASEFLPQLEKKVLIIGENLKHGLTYIGWGLVKKVVFADNIASLVDSIFSNPIGLSSFHIIIGTLAFGVQIYCDFSGYADIAIGTARIFGFKLPKNFNKPYFARNPSDFWSRWNITLSTWLRDYLYIPLGGNRKGRSRTFINLMTTMFLGGLWHGAAWNFVIWGIYHGTLLVAYKWVTDRFSLIKSRITSVLITQYFIFLGWLIFRVGNSEHLLFAVKKFLFLDFFSGGISKIMPFFLENKFSILLIMAFFYLHALSYKMPNILERINSSRLSYWFAYVMVITLLLFLFTPSASKAFIYFQF
ncbi:MBOAT family protein [Candidatus Woesearchaeota archaeon]|nr:MBOAT family protein [Candidatus Woesearchaeota archaeon]